MVATIQELDREAFLARLATTAYQVVLRRGFKGSFAEMQLDLWHSLQEACADVDFVTEGDDSWGR